MELHLREHILPVWEAAACPLERERKLPYCQRCRDDLIEESARQGRLTVKIRTRAIVLAAAVVMAGASLASQASADQPTAWRVDCPQAAIFPVFVTNPQDLGAVIGVCVNNYSGTPTVTVLR